MSALDEIAHELKGWREMKPEQLLKEASFRAVRGCEKRDLAPLLDVLRAAYVRAMEFDGMESVYCAVANAHNCSTSGSGRYELPRSPLEHIAQELRGWREMKPEQLLKAAAFRAVRGHEERDLAPLLDVLQAAYVQAMEFDRVAILHCALANAHNCAASLRGG